MSGSIWILERFLARAMTKLVPKRLISYATWIELPGRPQ
jgi:hypothetical protein